MLSEKEIRDKVSDYVVGKVSLDDFEDWFAAASWNIHKNPDLSAQHLAFAVELRLAEHSSGHLPEPDMREEFNWMVHSPVLVLVNSDNDVQSSTSSLPIRPQRLVFQPVDRAPAMASE